jgi:hypothetical protein
LERDHDRAEAIQHRRAVIYLVHCNAKAEEGVITRFNEKYVFVRIGKEEESAVTTRDELEWQDARSRSS